MTRWEPAITKPGGKEVPCLVSSVTSHDILSSSMADILSTDTSEEEERVIVPSRRVIRSRGRPRISSSERSRSPQTQLRSVGRDEVTSMDLPSNGAPTSQHRSLSRPRPISVGRRSSRSRSRPRPVRPRSQSRPKSTDHYMSQLDGFLQAGSGLRLEANGKCTFLFEGQRFVIEAEGRSTGDFLFYASLGPLKKLQQLNKPKNLLRLMASWNEELKERPDGSKDQEEGRENSGLLRIDSSTPRGPHVALIYYGHLDRIVNAAHFQDKLDEFVDDAIKYLHKIRGTKGKLGDRIARSCSPSSHSSVSDDGRTKLNGDSKNSNRKNSKEPTALQKKTATLSTPTTSTITAQNPSTEVASSTTTPKTSIFTKVISSLNRPHVNLGYQEQDCFVVDRQAVEEGTVKPTIVLSRVGEKCEGISEIGDQHAVKKGSSFHDRGEQNSSRKGSPFHDRGEQHTVRKGASFHDRSEQHTVRKGASFHDRGEHHPVRKGASFHDRGEYHSVRKGASFHDRGDHHTARKGASFHDRGSAAEYTRPGKGRSFHAADDENICQAGASAHVIVLPCSPPKAPRTPSIHIDNSRNASVARTEKSKSFNLSDNYMINNTNLTKIKERVQLEGSARINGQIAKRHSSVETVSKSSDVKSSGDPQHGKMSHRSSYW
jgi:hypothetical protein